MKHLRLVPLAATLVAAALATNAQTVTSLAPGPPPPVVPIGFGPGGSMISAKQHAPFSAVLVQQVEQTLNDGTTIKRENGEVVMRDGVGRTYRGRQLKTPGNSESEPRMIVTVTDPIQHVQYVCTPVKVCRKMAYRLPPNLRQRRPLDAKKMPDITVEDLGPSNIGGVEVVGTRITRLIPEGMVGNDRPMTTSEERWYSSQLDVDVQVKRSDPRTGTQTTTLTEVNLGEPDSKYFQIPEGYRVEDRQQPFGASGGTSPLPTENETSYPHQ